MLRLSFKVLTDIDKWQKAEIIRMRKALYLAVNQEIRRLMNEGKQDIKTGELSLAPKQVYKNIPGDPAFKRHRSKFAAIPLRNFFKGFQFEMDLTYGAYAAGRQRKLVAAVGFLGRTGSTQWQARLAEKSAQGYTWQYPKHAREFLAAMGIHLRKTTTSGKVPPRDILAAIRERNPDHVIMKNIKTLFDRKMAGEKI